MKRSVRGKGIRRRSAPEDGDQYPEGEHQSSTQRAQKDTQADAYRGPVERGEEGPHAENGQKEGSQPARASAQVASTRNSWPR